MFKGKTMVWIRQGDTRTLYWTANGNWSADRKDALEFTELQAAQKHLAYIDYDGPDSISLLVE